MKVDLNKLHTSLILTKSSLFGWWSSIYKTYMPDYTPKFDEIDIEFEAITIPNQTKLLKFNIYFTLPKSKFFIGEAIINVKTDTIERLDLTGVYKKFGPINRFLGEFLSNKLPLTNRFAVNKQTLFECLANLNNPGFKTYTITLNGLFAFIVYYALNKYWSLKRIKYNFELYVQQLNNLLGNVFETNECIDNLFWIKQIDNDNSNYNGQNKLYCTIGDTDLLNKVNIQLRDYLRENKQNFIAYTNWVLDLNVHEVIFGYVYDSDFGFEQETKISFADYVNPSLPNQLPGLLKLMPSFDFSPYLQFAFALSRMQIKYPILRRPIKNLTLKAIATIHNLSRIFTENLTL